MSPYTDRAELVFRFAKDMARRFGHCEVHAIHVLHALMQEGSGVAANVLKNHGFSAEKVEQAIKSNEGWFFTSAVLPDDLPWSKFAQFATREAVREAFALRHSYVGTEHILLAMTKLSTHQWFSLASEEDLISISQDLLSLLSPGKEEKKEPEPLDREAILKKVFAIRDAVKELAKDLQEA